MNRSVFLKALSALLLLPLLALSACSSLPKAAELLPFSPNTGLDMNGFFTNVKAADHVKLPEYKGITLPEDLMVASEEDIDEQIRNVCAQFATYEHVTEGTVEDGDTLNIDYVGKVNGVEFEGGSTMGYGTEVTIGVTNYIDGFLDQLIGHHPGETFDIKVKFPDNYGKDELNGKDAVFTITINYLCGEEVIPELNDEIFASYDCANEEELRALITDWLVEQQIYTFMKDLMKQAEAKGSIPSSVLNYIIGTELSQYEENARTYSMDLNTYIKTLYQFDTADKYIADKDRQKSFKAGAVYFMAYQAIAELEGLTVTDEDIESAGMTEYLDTYGAPYIRMVVLQQVTVPNFILANAANAPAK